MNLVIAHLGGGISATAHSHGRIIDSMDSNSGAFSPERAGILPSRALAKLIYSNKFTEAELYKRLEGNGGMLAYLGTADGRDVEKMIASGNKQAELIYHAMALQVSKEIGPLSPDLLGNVDAIVHGIREPTAFIARVTLFPGEYEMEALALGALRVLNRHEEAQIYQERG